MDVFLQSEIGRGITGVVISIGLTLIAFFPVLLMELVSVLIPAG